MTDASEVLSLVVVSGAGTAESKNILEKLSDEARVILAYMTAHPQKITWAMGLAAGLNIDAGRRLYRALDELVRQDLISKNKEDDPPVGRAARNHYTIGNQMWCRLQFERLYPELLEHFTNLGPIESVHA